MINDQGQRSAAAPEHPDAIPPHMLVGRPSSAVQAEADAGTLGGLPPVPHQAPPIAPTHLSADGVSERRRQQPEGERP